MSAPAASFSQLPSVDRVLSSPAAAALSQCYSRDAVTESVRAALERLRGRIRGGDIPDAADLSVEGVVDRAAAALSVRSAPKLKRVVNATGVVLHTNLGRAALAQAAIDAVVAAASGACNLEYDLDRAERGDRDDLVEEHLCALTGAEAATVVNNNAAAVILVLNTLAEGREAVVSRGELIEIGGSFRIPDIMAKSGARLREVGTTNRTHASDYANAIGPDTALLMKVHASNYRIIGFSSGVELEELAPMAAAHPGLLIVEDLGAGALVDFSRWGLPAEPVIGERLRAGADVVTCSGDKLLGGPQCGIIVGRSATIKRLKRNPLRRALRCDKMTLAALEATLRLYRFAPDFERKVPTLRALLRPLAELREVGEAALPLLSRSLGPDFTLGIVSAAAQAGSGSQPEVPIDSLAIAVSSPDHSAQAIARRFRTADPPVIGRIERDVFLLDLRTIEDPADLVPVATRVAG